MAVLVIAATAASRLVGGPTAGTSTGITPLRLPRSVTVVWRRGREEHGDHEIRDRFTPPQQQVVQGSRYGREDKVVYCRALLAARFLDSVQLAADDSKLPLRTCRAVE